MKLTVAGWNINSVRLRCDLVIRFLERFDPDILCLQEIKCRTDAFPYDRLRPLRPHIAVNGIKGYHGVAVLSRFPFGVVEARRFQNKDDGRHIAVTLPDCNHLKLHNFYIPAGGDVPDRERNEKFAHKLDFVDEAASWPWRSPSVFADPNRTVLVGDFNIAPLESDVWSHRQLLGVVSHTPIEVEKLTGFQRSKNWVDAVRMKIPPPQKLYSWWSYRARDWRASDRGRRLDHIWASADMARHCASASILKELRDWPRPSDHVPVTVAFEADGAF